MIYLKMCLKWLVIIVIFRVLNYILTIVCNSTQQRQDVQAPSPAPTQTYRESYNYVQSTPVATSYEKQSYYQQPQAQHNTTDSYYQQTNKYGKTGKLKLIFICNLDWLPHYNY